MVGCDPSLDNFTYYRQRWYMDNSPSQNMWYSFNYSYATFVSISSETDFPLAPEGLDTTFLCGPFGDQLTWLEAQLQAANANRANRPWLIVTGHRPMYSCPISDFPPDARLRLRQAMEGMFIKYKVDVYLSGHSMYSSSFFFFFFFFVFFHPVFFLIHFSFSKFMDTNASIPLLMARS
ncbi:MAG: metallophosphoesterase [archaeon]|nr:metallophosphoesterase [archaeon]